MTSCGSGHAIVLASWEKNSKAWLDGDFYRLRSNKRRLQKTVGDGGTLWIVVSRPAGNGRLYTVSFRLNKCRSETYKEDGDFGRFGVIGNKQSKFFAANDARLLLLALRFDPVCPINGPADNQISNSIRTVRCLSQSDVELLESNVVHSDRWSTFVSYRRKDSKLAMELSEALQLQGLSVFRDLEGLRAGDEWWPTLKRAIARSQRLVVLIGRQTHKSPWVRREINYALKNNVPVVPVLAGGNFQSWGALGERLSSRHALHSSAGIDAVVAGLSW